MEKCDIIVFAPHPDDEALGCAALIYKALRRKKKVKVVVVANGESSVGGTERFFGRKPATQDFIDIGIVRQKESVSAMETLGLPGEDLIFLGYPNDGLQEMVTSDSYTKDNPYSSTFTGFDRVSYENSYNMGAPFCRESFFEDIRAIMEGYQPKQVYVTHPLDSHLDHRACGSSVHEIARKLDKSIKVYGYLISTSKLPSPNRRMIYKSTGQLREDFLNKQMREIKEECFKRYESQMYLLDQLSIHFEAERFFRFGHTLIFRVVKKIFPSLRF